MEEIYTESEVNKIREIYKNAIGHKYYWRHGETDTLREINISQSGEIALKGEIYPGYQVLFLFQNRNAISHSSFALLNEIKPFISGHIRLDLETKNAIITEKSMKGDWISEDTSVHLVITEEEIRVEKDGVKSIHPASGEWWDKYYISHDRKVFITSANNEKLVFGQLENPTILPDGISWKKKFDRVAIHL